MGLDPVTLRLIAPQLKAAGEAGCTSRKVLSLGYPDILARHDHLAEIFGDEVAERVSYREDSAEIMRWHGVPDFADRVPDASSLFEVLGYKLEVIDITAARGGEILHDLNEPVPEELKGRYALVLDSGTLEHVFNIGQGAKSAAEMVALGGSILHINPFNIVNHGFYNINPTWYYDLYGENGFQLELVQLVADTLRDPKVVHKVPPYVRFYDVPNDSAIVVVARRKNMNPVKWPVQWKYRMFPNLRQG